jgi:hypothetical protein
MIPASTGWLLSALHQQQDADVEGIREVPRKQPQTCCCTNNHRPWLLNGSWVVSTSPGCPIHYGREEQWIASRIPTE